MLIHRYEPGRPVRTGKNCIIVEAGDSPENMTQAEFSVMLENGWNINHENDTWEYTTKLFVSRWRPRAHPPASRHHTQTPINFQTG